ncbi:MULTISPECIES: hypothetical protein [Clostridia]|uniref:hypothetical protein n=1 Tax=Clostridia TaxID=186801 RepID=UPI00067F45B1|nr:MULTISPECIES: hypothetical protein [Clostridia]
MRRNKGRILQVILFLNFVVSSGILMYDLVISPKQNQEMAKQLKEEFGNNMNSGAMFGNLGRFAAADY